MVSFNVISGYLLVAGGGGGGTMVVGRNLSKPHCLLHSELPPCVQIKLPCTVVVYDGEKDKAWCQPRATDDATVTTEITPRNMTGEARECMRCPSDLYNTSQTTSSLSVCVSLCVLIAFTAVSATTSRRRSYFLNNSTIGHNDAGKERVSLNFHLGTTLLRETVYVLLLLKSLFPRCEEELIPSHFSHVDLPLLDPTFPHQN